MKKIMLPKLIVFDFDGVMTDNKLRVNEHGEESVVVNRGDGLGVKMLRKAGIQMLIVSTEENKVVSCRAKKIGVPCMQGIDDKATALRAYCVGNAVELRDVLYVGNDINDLEAMKIVGTRIVPADAHLSVKNIADVVLVSCGGGGVVRELADILLEGAKEMGEAILDANDSELIRTRILEARNSVDLLLSNSKIAEKILSIANLMFQALASGNRIYFCGNGGSAADCQHVAAEFVGRFFKERRALPVEALTVNTSILTALANDYDYSKVFSRQVEAFGSPGDICVGLSTSGNSKNVELAMLAAKAVQMNTVAVIGSKGGTVGDAADISLQLPSSVTPRIQEMTILVFHIICEIVENKIVNTAKG